MILFIYSNTEKEFKYQFMGSMAQLGTWDAVVDLGQGSKGTLSVICLFCFFSWWLEGLIMIDNYSGTCSICCVEVGLLGLPGKKSSCEYDNKKSICEYNNRYDGQMTRISQYFSRCPSRTNSLSPCTGSSLSGLDETYPNSNSPMFPILSLTTWFCYEMCFLTKRIKT